MGKLAGMVPKYPNDPGQFQVPIPKISGHSKGGIIVHYSIRKMTQKCTVLARLWVSKLHANGSDSGHVIHLYAPYS